MSRPPQHGGAVPLRARTTTPGLPRGPSGSRLAPLANRLHLNHGGCGAHGGGGAARSLAPLPRPHPRRHLPQLALHRGLRLHARQGEPGGGGGARGGGWQRLPLTPPPPFFLFSFSPWPQMAAAGFVHCPSENGPDVAQCFFCLKELEGWEPDDDPL